MKILDQGSYIFDSWNQVQDAEDTDQLAGVMGMRNFAQPEMLHGNMLQKYPWYQHFLE